MKTRLLVVEDNRALRQDMIFHLELAGFEAHGVEDGMAMDASLRGQAFDILLLDIGLPFEDGFDITQRLKISHPTLGIIIITADAQISSRILGHKLGADHYLAKPVNYVELAAIVETLSARLKLGKAANTPPEWVLDLLNMTLIAPDKEVPEIPLTWNEVKILEAFGLSDNHCCSKTTLITALGQDELAYDIRRLETLMSRLRKKINHAFGYDYQLLRSMRNVGYQFQAALQVRSDSSTD